VRGVRRCLAIVVVAAVGMSFVPENGAGAATAARRVVTVRLAPGLTLTHIRDSRGPWRIHVLTIDPSRPVTVAVATPGPMGTFARPSQIGRAWGALAAINGDFSAFPGRPLHPIARSGFVKTTGRQIGPGFGTEIAGTAVVGVVHPRVWVRDETTAGTFGLAHVNAGQAGRNSVVAFTPYGGRAERPPARACWVRLRAIGRRAWAPGHVAMIRRYRVSARGCTVAPAPVPARTIVLSSRLTGPGSASLRSMWKGHVVRLRWATGWTGVLDSIGGAPWLVNRGLNVAPTCTSYLCRQHPRTGIGVRADGKILLVTVDGRQARSEGMGLIQFANLMRSLGARFAMNLDGGGGSTMWTSSRGIVSNPSDPSGERPVTSAVLVLRKRLPAGRTTGVARSFVTHVPVVPVSASEAAEAQSLAAADGGSTGGLLDLIEALGQGTT
jgi:phosphodiester glycosidase